MVKREVGVRRGDTLKEASVRGRKKEKEAS